MRKIDLRLGDCLEVLKQLPDNSIDSCVCDPPYGLTPNTGNSKERSTSSVLLNVVLPDLANLYTKGVSDRDLPFPRNSILFLDWALRSIGIKSGVGVPESSINLNGCIKCGNKKIKAAGKSSITSPNSVLTNEINSNGTENVCDYVLNFRPFGYAAFGDGLSSCLRKFGPGRFAMTVVIPFSPSGDSFFGPSNKDFFTNFFNSIGLCDNSFADSKTSGLIMTESRAEIICSLSVDLRNGTAELLPADSATQIDMVAEFIPTKLVTACPRACSLSAKFKPCSIGLVNGEANGTFSFYLHNELLNYINYSQKGFMGQLWDYDVPSVDIWQEVLRVLKPGGHLLAFFGTRTYHRGVVNIEDAGFEIRDQLSWVYGSGFPKSTDISKQLDKMNGAEREVIGTSKSGGYKRIMETNAEHGYRPENYYDEGNKFVSDEPVTDEARQWHGWGTGLKPAQEPIVLARKPFKGTIARNVLKYGTGAININDCRVGEEYIKPRKAGFNDSPVYGTSNGCISGGHNGRWPANLMHDGSEEVLELFPDTAPSKSGGVSYNATTIHLDGKAPHPRTGHDDDGGSAARFFYCAKPSVSEKEAGLDELADSTLNRVNSGGLENDPKWAPKTRKNNHPTVKPVKLMQYLCRLITPPGGTVLDPFMGSGTTGMAAVSEGFDFFGIELDEHYLEIARKRIEHFNKDSEA